LLDAFREGRDVYSEFGTKAFNCEVSKTVNPDLRFFSKETVLGCGYGMGKEKFAHYLEVKGKKIDRATSDMLVDKFRREYREIPKLWRELDNVIRWHLHPAFDNEEELGPITFKSKSQMACLPNGLFLDYSQQDPDKIWGGKLLENIVQALARIVLTDAWLRVREANIKVVLQVHDELVCCVPKGDVDWAKEVLTKAMVQAPSWAPDLPLAMEVDHGQCYSK
jgi:DNA polymerase